MKIRDLTDIAFEDLIACFLKAFENYFVEMPQEIDYYKNRWEAAKVDYYLSYGMFDEGQLVGFIIHAVDYKDGKLTAYNTGTGVIPGYRGQRIVKSIYDHAIPLLRDRGIECCTLEVITENNIALRSYQGIGFTKSKTFKCYGGNIQLNPNYQVDIIEKKIGSIDWHMLPNQEYYSWDNRKESLMHSNFRYYEVVHEAVTESFFIIDLKRKYIAQCDVFIQGQDTWDRLFLGVDKLTNYFRTNNVDERLVSKVEALDRGGLENPADQYEMYLNINRISTS